MDRMFVDPETGDIRDERWFRMQDIDLDTVIEAIKIDDNGSVGFVIIPENINRMKVRNSVVINLISEFTGSILERMSETDDEDEREQLREIGKRICTLMMFKIAELEKEQNGADFNQNGRDFRWSRADFR